MSPEPENKGGSGSPALRPEFAVCLGLALLAALVYSRVPGFDFVTLDDNLYVSANPHLAPGFTPRGLAWAATTFRGGLYMPLVWITYLADHSLYGPFAGGYHFTNLVLHLGAAILLFLLFRAMTGKIAPAALTAALFAAHPLHVESVAWVTERKDVLSALFFFAAALAYARFTRSRRARDYALLFLFFVLGLLSKAMVVTLPAALLVLDYWPLGRFPEKVRPAALWPLVREKIPLFAASLFFSWLTVFAQKDYGAMAGLGDVPLPDRLANAVVSYVRYLEKLVWPKDLAVFYPRDDLALVSAPVLLAAGLLVLLTLGVWFARRRAPYLLAGWLFYLGTLFPVIGLLQTGDQAMADRFAYIPAVGLYAAASFGLFQAFGRSRAGRRVLALPALLLVLALGFVARNQADAWENSRTLYSQALQATENNWRIHSLLGDAYAMEREYAMALPHLDRALEIRPRTLEALLQKGLILQDMGRDGEATEIFGKAVDLDPQNAQARLCLASNLAQNGRFREALVQFEEASRLEPDDARILTGLGQVRAATGDSDQAVRDLSRALRLNPSYSPAWNNLGLLTKNAGDFEAARRLFETAARLDPKNAEALNNLGILLFEIGEREQALFRFAAAIRARPGFAEAQRNLALAREIMAREKERKGSNP